MALGDGHVGGVSVGQPHNGMGATWFHDAAALLWIIEYARRVSLSACPLATRADQLKGAFPHNGAPFLF